MAALLQFCVLRLGLLQDGEPRMVEISMNTERVARRAFVMACSPDPTILEHAGNKNPRPEVPTAADVTESERAISLRLRRFKR
jgi:hypothetical protein